MPPADALEEIDTLVIVDEELTEIESSETPLLEIEEDIYDEDIVESDENLQDESTAETDLEIEDAEPSVEEDNVTYETVQDEIADKQADEELEEIAEIAETEQSSCIPEELAILLATNQADSMMGGLGMTRNESCTQVVAVFTLSDYTQNPVMDANYATLWMDMSAVFQSIAQASSANCIYDNGTITILK